MVVKSPKDENALLLLLKQSDEQAFEELYQQYSGRIYGNILKLIKNKESAQELLQEVFMKLWERRADIDIKTSFAGYLFSTSRHMVYNFIRRLSVEQQAAAYLSITHSELYLHVEEDIALKETESALQEAIENLPPRRREIYKLCKLEEKSYEEVSILLGISTSTINDHMVKANRFIKEQLGQSELLAIALLASFFIKP